jgi:hypothetical protein
MEESSHNETDQITYFTQKDKKKYLDDPSLIDQGIKELADAINGVDVFFTMNSCQGFLVENERDNHCPETYVDFYVINEDYSIGHRLLAGLANTFDGLINCKLVYEPNFDFISEEEVKSNGFVNLRYSIELFELVPELMQKTYQELIQYIQKFARKVNK